MSATSEYEKRMQEVFDKNKNSKKQTASKNLKKQQKKDKKKGKKMNHLGYYIDGEEDWGGYGVVTGRAGAAVNTATLLTGDDVVNITNSVSKKNRGYIAYMQKDLQKIYEKSGPHAYDNEFQVHYWFLNLRFRADDDKSIIDIAIPTCYFNYEQFVTSGHVDFELKDVGPLSDKVLPLSNMKINELMTFGIKEKIEALFENKLQFEAIAVNCGTLHRHPGTSNSQSFSSTDLNISVKTENDALGVVFPLAEAEDDKPSFSAIVALDGAFGHWNNKDKKCNLAHCEYRLANGKIQTGLHYEKNRCIAFSIIPAEQPSVVERLFGAQAVSKTVTKYDNTEVKLYKIEEELVKLFEELETVYEASTLAVLPDNVKLKHPPRPATTTAHVYGNESAFNYNANRALIGANANTPENAKEAVKETTKKFVSMHDRYLQSKSLIVKYKNNFDFLGLVRSYLTMTKEYKESLAATKENLTKLIADYNAMGKMFNGANHKDEEVDFYLTTTQIVDYRDIRDFMEDNILMAENIADEMEESIKEIKDYENSDTNILKNTHLYFNPFPTQAERNAKKEESGATQVVQNEKPEDYEVKPQENPTEALEHLKAQAHNTISQAKQAAESVLNNKPIVTSEPERKEVQKQTVFGAITGFVLGNN